MEEEILKEVVQELKGLRGESIATNQRLDVLNSRVDGLTQRIDGVNDGIGGLNQRVDGLNQRVDTLGGKVDGLNQSVIVLQQEVVRSRTELQQIKEFLVEKVISQNDSVSIETREGKVIYGTIHRESRK